MTYTVYNNATCSSDNGGLVATLGPVTVTDGNVADSPTWTPTETAGTYYFVASYSGDANNSATVSACAADADHGESTNTDDRHAALGYRHDAWRSGS